MKFYIWKNPRKKKSLFLHCSWNYIYIPDKKVNLISLIPYPRIATKKKLSCINNKHVYKSSSADYNIWCVLGLGFLCNSNLLKHCLSDLSSWFQKDYPTLNLELKNKRPSWILLFRIRVWEWQLLCIFWVQISDGRWDKLFWATSSSNPSTWFILILQAVRIALN